MKNERPRQRGRSFCFNPYGCNKWGLSRCFQKVRRGGGPRGVMSLGNVHAKLLKSYIHSINDNDYHCQRRAKKYHKRHTFVVASVLLSLKARLFEP